MPTMVYALMGSINHGSFHDEAWLDSIYSTEEAAYIARRERYLHGLQKQVNILNEDPKAELTANVKWFVSTRELK